MRALGRFLSGPLMAAASIALVLLAFELGLRAFSPAAPDPDAGPIEQLFVPSADPELGFEHARDVHVRFPARSFGDRTTAAWEVWIDANGLRRNGRADPLESELRGICLGDSTMFGAGLNDGETIPAQLGAIVSERLDRRFECLNLAVCNYTTAQEVALFRRSDALRFDPRVVVLGIFTNDFKVGMGRMEGPPGVRQLISPDAPAGLDGGLGSLRVVRLAASAARAGRDRLRRTGLYPQANGKPLRPEEIAAVYGPLDALRAMLAPRDIPLVLVLFPRDWQLGARDREAASERQAAALAYCRQHGLRCVDLLDDWFGRPVEDYFRPGDDSHPHAQAARASAERVAEAVVQALASGH